MVEFLKIFQKAEFNKISLSSVINTNLLNKKWMHQTTFYGPSYTNKKMCKKAHTYILYFMFVCIVCFIWFFICFAVVSIFCNKFEPWMSLRHLFRLCLMLLKQNWKVLFPCNVQGDLRFSPCLQEYFQEMLCRNSHENGKYSNVRCKFVKS